MERREDKTCESLNVEAHVPKLVEITVGDGVVISGVLNTGSVLTVRAPAGGGAGAVHVKADDLAPARRA